MFKKIFFICCVIVLLSACPAYHPLYPLSIINHSDEDIFWLSMSARDGEWYEIISIDSYMGGQYDKHVILRESSSRDDLTDGIKTTLNLYGWIKYTLFNYDSIKTVPWQRICEERIILKEVRFDSWEDFERCNFEITYP